MKIKFKIMFNKAIERIELSNNLYYNKKYELCSSNLYYSLFQLMNSILGKSSKGIWEHNSLATSFNYYLFSNKIVNRKENSKFFSVISELYKLRVISDYKNQVLNLEEIEDLNYYLDFVNNLFKVTLKNTGDRIIMFNRDLFKIWINNLINNLKELDFIETIKMLDNEEIKSKGYDLFLRILVKSEIDDDVHIDFRYSKEINKVLSPMVTDYMYENNYPLNIGYDIISSKKPISSK